MGCGKGDIHNYLKVLKRFLLDIVREKVNFLGCFDYGGKIVAVARKKEIYVEWLGHINKQGYYNDRPAS